MGKDSEVT